MTTKRTRTLIAAVILVVLLAAGALVLRTPMAGFLRRLREARGRTAEFLTETLAPRVTAPSPLFGPTEGPPSLLTEAGVLAFTNKARRDSGLPPLAEQNDLAEAADIKAADMIARQYFAHTAPDGRDAGDLAAESGYSFIAIGENLALGNFEDDQALVQAWMDSPGHRANILGESFQDIGVAVRRGAWEGRTTWFAVQIFGRPQSACPAPDAGARAQIEENRADLASLEVELNRRRGEFNAMRPRRGEAFQQALGDYNALIEVYNNLARNTDALIRQHNREVSVYNACVEGV